MGAADGSERGFGEEVVEVQAVGEHCQGAVCGAGPLVGGAVPVEFDAVLVGVGEVEGFADAVIGGAVEGDVGGGEAAEGVGEGGAGGVEDCGVEEAGCAFGRG